MHIDALCPRCERADLDVIGQTVDGVDVQLVTCQACNYVANLATVDPQLLAKRRRAVSR